MKQKHKITCLRCKEHDVITVLDDQYVSAYERQANTNFLSARKREDGTWGFECRCGNDNRIAANEVANIDELIQRGDKTAVDNIKSQLLIPDNKQFIMEKA